MTQKKTPKGTNPKAQPTVNKAGKGKAPEEQVPETKVPETNPDETQAPETKAPENKPDESPVSETKAPETQPAEAQAPDLNAAEETGRIKAKRDRLKRAAEVFASHTVDQLHFTDDGTCFINPQYATMHAQTLNNDQVTIVTRKEVEDAPKS